MILRGCARDVPDLLKPPIKVRLRDPARIPLPSRGASVSPRLPRIKMNSMSFLMMAFGSYGLPRNFDPLDTSYEALAILCQMMGLRLSNPMRRQVTAMSA